MADFNIRSDAVDVEQVMRQIRARIREKRGVDYTEEEIRRLATAKLERFLEPGGIRSDLVEQFRRQVPDPPLNYSFEDDTLYTSHRAPLRWIRRVLNPVLKLFFNPNPLIHVLHVQSQINDRFYAWVQKREQQYFEVMHNLVLEVTKLGIEVKNLRMRVESLSSRLDFDERRGRALEGVVQYKPADEAAGNRHAAPDEDIGEERRRRRRRRRRRTGRTSGEQGVASGAPDQPNQVSTSSDRETATDAGDNADAAPDEPHAEDQ